MSARAGLRAATADAHARVDALFSRYDLAARSGYGAFLRAQAAAFLPVEAALDAAGAERWFPDWPERRRGALLRADLDALGAAPAAALAPPPLDGAAAVAGAVYVLEGSRLGGAVLKRLIPADAPQAFLAARGRPGSWRKLLERLDDLLYAPNLVDSAAGAAEAVFDRFENAGRLMLETVSSDRL